MAAVPCKGPPIKVTASGSFSASKSFPKSGMETGVSSLVVIASSSATGRSFKGASVQITNTVSQSGTLPLSQIISENVDWPVELGNGVRVIQLSPSFSPVAEPKAILPIKPVTSWASDCGSVAEIQSCAGVSSKEVNKIVSVCRPNVSTAGGKLPQLVTCKLPMLLR